MNAKYTPGPWTWRDVAGAGLQIFGNPGPMSGGPWGPNGLGPVNTWGLVKSPHPILLSYERWVQFAPAGWNEMQIANARLIAASPDMLHTLKLSERWFADHRPPDASALTIAEIIRDSIARATQVSPEPV